MLSFVSGFLCYCWMLFRCVDVPHILFLPFLAPLFVYFERCCSEHSRTSLCVDLHFHFSWSCWLYSKSMFSFFFKKLSNCFQSGCTILHAHQQRVQVLASPCPWRHMMLPLFRVTVFERVQSGISLWFALHFPDHSEHFLCLLVGHSSVFFGEMSDWIFCPF